MAIGVSYLKLFYGCVETLCGAIVIIYVSDDMEEHLANITSKIYEYCP